MRSALSVVLGLAVGSVSVAQAPSALYVVQNPTPAVLLQLHQHFDVLGGCCGTVLPGGRIEFVVEAGQVGLLRRIAPDARWVADSRPFHDVELERHAAFPGDVPPAGYFTVAEIEAEIDAQVAAYPTLAQKVDLSALPGGVPTHEGRPIYALKVSDNVGASEDEPAILLAAQHHARELNSPYMVLGAIFMVLAGYATDPPLQAVVDQFEIWFVPMVNPDGVEHVWTVDQWWRKNRRFNGGSSYGVDLNRNFPFLWGLCGASTNPSSQTYRGPAAGSEPETQVMRNLVGLLRPEIYLDFHSFGREVLQTYAPCATVNPTVYSFLDRYVDDLRVPMGYAKRDPSASGEAPEDHWASGGTLSFLIEVGTAFQPPFPDTVNEEASVWPGIRRALTAWRPALRGHVRSALGGAPLAATITFAPNLFSHGEATRSRASDGRYGMWLPLGNWNVTFSAPGHQSRTLPVSVLSYDSPQLLDVALDTAAPGTPTIVKVGTGALGTVVDFTYTSPGDAGRMSFFGWALDTTPGIPLGDQRVVPLNNDPFFQAAWIGNPFLSPTFGTLNGADQAQCVLIVPNAAWLVGLTTWVGGLTLDPAWLGGVKTWSQPVPVTIVP